MAVVVGVLSIGNRYPVRIRRHHAFVTRNFFLSEASNLQIATLSRDNFRRGEPMSYSPLTNIKVAAPCKTEWKWMYGNARVRFCPQCSLNVYNLSAMSKEEAERLILQTEGRLCVRFYRRKDGT